MSGTWIGESGSTTTEEHWTLPRGGTMLGVNRTINNDQTVFFEYLRIEHRADGIYYLASPKGHQPPTPFKLVQHTETKDHGRVVFENPEHDFPQRIVYQREGEIMQVQIEGLQGGRITAEGWTWRRMK